MSQIYHVTDAEFSLLELLWEHGPSTIRQITERHYPRATHSQQASVNKLIQRLESKGILHRDRSSFAHVIKPLVSREELVGQQLQAVADKIGDGSIAPLLMQMISDKKLSQRERRQLRQMLDEFE